MTKVYKYELKKRLNRWKAVDYNHEAALGYFMGTKAAFDFACLTTILKEIQARQSQFAPETLLDFGSGIGTVTWAVKQVFGASMKEAMNVESSKHMHDFARMLACKTKDNSSPDLPQEYNYRFKLSRDETVSILSSFLDNFQSKVAIFSRVNVSRIKLNVPF